jgi:hypothetical protein
MLMLMSIWEKISIMLKRMFGKEKLAAGLKREIGIMQRMVAVVT